MAVSVGMSTSQLFSWLLTFLLTSLLTVHIAQDIICITDLCSSPHVFYNCEMDLQPPVAETYSTQVVLSASHHVVLWLRHGPLMLYRKKPLATSTHQTDHKQILPLISGIELNPGDLYSPVLSAQKHTKQIRGPAILATAGHARHV